MDIKAILNQSLNYPSGDNCQPFRFKILSESQFEIHYLTAVGQHRLNSANLASYLSLGTLIESIAIAARASGFDYEVQLMPFKSDSNNQSEVWAVVKLLKTDRVSTLEERFLFENLNLRETNRFDFGREPVDPKVIAWLNREAQKHPKLGFTFQESLNPDFANMMAECEEEIWKDQSAVKDIFKWIRFDQTSLRTIRDGMPFSGLGVAAFQKPFLKLFSKFPNLFLALTAFGITKANKKMMQKWIQNSAGFGWISLPGSEFSTVVEAGQLIFRMWVYLNANGYGFQP